MQWNQSNLIFPIKIMSATSIIPCYLSREGRVGRQQLFHAWLRQLILLTKLYCS